MTARTERFLQMQNMRAHYQNMLKVEPTISFDDEVKPRKRQPRYQHILTKTEKNKEYDRLLNNTLIYQRLRNIGTGKQSRNISNIESLEKRSPSTTVHSERRTIAHLRQRMQPEIDRENAILVNRIRTIEPTVYTK